MVAKKATKKTQAKKKSTKKKKATKKNKKISSGDDNTSTIPVPKKRIRYAPRKR